MDNYDDASAAWPTYQSHRTVRAAKITNLIGDNVYTSDACFRAQANKPKPAVGWWVICYEDGYYSFCPAESFEKGYRAVAPAGRSLHPSTFEYLKPTDAQISTMAVVRSTTADYVRFLEDHLPVGADKTYVLRKLREVAMWANVAITREADGTPRA